MLTINDVSYSIGDSQILSHVTYTLSTRVVALVGNNGAGKTTLFRIIMGEIKPDSGSISAPHEVIGYLPQQIQLENLSGGEKTRIYLENILSAEPAPTILLLDEPTNNLDLETIDWLKQTLKSFPGLVLLASHDRRFLDDTVDSIIELDAGVLKQYGGNYSLYKEQKAGEKEAYERRYLAQQKK